MIVKPMRLGALRRVEANSSGACRLWITALGAFEMNEPGDFLTEAQLWQTAAPALGDAVLDPALPKPRSEVLVAGDACAPDGETVRSLAVHLEFGPIRKRLAAFGRRWWTFGPDGPVMTRPEPFERVSLGWHNAFGGPGHEENPIGKGANALAAMKRGEPAELPMIEVPETLITDIEQSPEPAGFGPRRHDAPSRLRFAGVYDDAWLRDGFPGPGRNFDRRYWNAACPDQQTDANFHGDEPFRVTSMHGQHTDMRGRLPGFRVRAFARQGDVFRELEMHCDTVWLLPGALVGIVLFRGGLAVADKEASDTPHVLLAYERLRDPQRSAAHYCTALDERIDPETAALKLLDERPLKPELSPAAIEAVEEERRALGEELSRRIVEGRRAAVADALGMAGLPAPPVGTFDDALPFDVDIPVVTPGEIERLEVDLAGLRAGVDEVADRVAKHGDRHLAKVSGEVADALPQLARGSEPRARSLMDERLTQISARLGDERLASGSGAPGAPGSGIGDVVSGLDDLFDRAGRLLGRKAGSTAAASNEAGAGMSDALRRARNRALGTPDQDDVLARARRQIALQAESVSSAPGQGDGSRASSPGVTNLFDAALQAVEGLRVAGAAEKRVAAEKLDAQLADPQVAYINELAQRVAADHGASESGMAPEAGIAEAQSRLDDAAGQIDEMKDEGRRASPEPMAPDEPLSARDSASLGALALDLVRGGEGLKGCDLAGADLSGADLAGMDLEGIFLEQAKLAGTNFAGAKLRRAVLTGADLSAANLSGADLTGSNLSGADLGGAVLNDARLERVQLIRSRLDGADLTGCSLSGADLVEVSMPGARLDGASISDAQFVKCDMSEVSLDGARLNRVVVLESDTAGFRAPAARFERCALVGVHGVGSDLSGAEFVRSACVGEAKFSRARMSGLVSSQSGWRGTDFSDADLTAARLDASDLGETKLTGACLHRASLKRAVLHKADIRGANLYGANLLEAQAQQANLERASLHRANLYSADLSDARLTLCDLTGANLVLTVMTRPANAG